MKYLVMECHMSYAVVLDETGRFLTVANMRYEVGQTVTDVVEMKLPDSAPAQNKSLKTRRTARWAAPLAALAACLALAISSFTGSPGATVDPYASVYMSINPEVRIDITQQEDVVGLVGINQDGAALIQDYRYADKSLDTVVDDLLDRAMEMEYLKENGHITLDMVSPDADWDTARATALGQHAKEYLEEKISVTIEVTAHTPEGQSVVIPLPPQSQDINYGDSDYGDDVYEDGNTDDDTNTDYATELPVPPTADTPVPTSTSSPTYAPTPVPVIPNNNSDYGQSDYNDATTDYTDYA